MDIRIIEGYENMDFDRVTELLSDANWSVGISRQEVEQGASNSALVLGALLDGVQVGYLRVISDKTRFGYFSDVYVDPDVRGRGIASLMMECALKHESLKDVYQWLLRTGSAQKFYESLGFSAVGQPECWMEIRKPRPER